MPYREIIAVCSQIHTKHINTLWGQSVELLNVKPAVHIVTTGLCSFTRNCTNAFHMNPISYITVALHTHCKGSTHVNVCPVSLHSTSGQCTAGHTLFVAPSITATFAILK